GDLLAGAGKNPLLRIEEFLEELFAGTEANELEFMARLAGETNQSFRQFHDSHRLSHVEYQDVSFAPDGEGLQHQAHRLRNGHEKAGDLRVGDGDGPVEADLFLKERNHAAVGAENVAEA